MVRYLSAAPATCAYNSSQRAGPLTWRAQALKAAARQLARCRQRRRRRLLLCSRISCRCRRTRQRRRLLALAGTAAAAALAFAGGGAFQHFVQCGRNVPAGHGLDLHRRISQLCCCKLQRPCTRAQLGGTRAAAAGSRRCQLVAAAQVALHKLLAAGQALRRVPLCRGLQELRHRQVARFLRHIRRGGACSAGDRSKVWGWLLWLVCACQVCYFEMQRFVRRSMRNFFAPTERVCCCWVGPPGEEGMHRF